LNFQPTKIQDVILIEPRVFEDPRGFFFESYNQMEFARHLIGAVFVQDNHSSSAKGVLRGLHFQKEPKAQAKLIRVIRGEIFDVVVDMRKESPTFGESFCTVLSAKSHAMLYIPKGLAHGFCVLEDSTEVLYKTSDFYSPAHESGIRWNDPTLAIKWPKLNVDYIISEKDQKLPFWNDLFKEAKQ
jgi:dTDP-4-dehydrorhamnose 3,5-epimerase